MLQTLHALVGQTVFHSDFESNGYPTVRQKYRLVLTAYLRIESDEDEHDKEQDGPNGSSW